MVIREATTAEKCRIILIISLIISSVIWAVHASNGRYRHTESCEKMLVDGFIPVNQKVKLVRGSWLGSIGNTFDVYETMGGYVYTIKFVDARSVNPYKSSSYSNANIPAGSLKCLDSK